jgi:hypothetical protein
VRCLAVLTLLAVAACSGSHNAASGSSASPSPLGACEVRVVAFDAGRALVTGNADGSLASVTMLDTPQRAAPAAVLTEATRAFGPLRDDARVVAHQSKWGLTTFTDACGRPMNPAGPAGRPH